MKRHAPSPSFGKASKHRSEGFKLPYGLLVVLGGVAYLAATGAIGKHIDLCIFGVGGTFALTISRYATAHFRALSRVAFVMAVLFAAAMPLLAWSSADIGNRDAPRPAQTKRAVTGFLEQTSRQSLGRALTATEQQKVAMEMRPLGPRAAEVFNASFAARWQADIGEKHLYQLSNADWVFWRDLCEIAVTYDMPDPDLAPTLRRYISDFLSNGRRFKLDPDINSLVRRHAAMSRYRANLHNCGNLFDFPA